MTTVSTTGPAADYRLAGSAIPFIIAPTGTMANNGAITLGTALATTYTKAYINLPASAIVAGSAAGWYYCVMSSTTVGTVYNNTYVSGPPTIPANPTAFVTVGPGAYTGVTTGVIGPQITIPGGVVGPNGALRTTFQNTVNANTNSKTLNYQINGVNLISTGLSTAAQFGTSQCVVTMNRGSQAVNTSPSPSTTGGFGVQPSSPRFMTTDFSVNQTWLVSATMAVATDYIVMEMFLIEVLTG